MREYVLVYVVENPIKAMLLLQRLSKDLNELSQWQAGLKKVADHNLAAAQKLRDLCQTALE